VYQQAVRITMREGSAVFWNQKTAHGSAPVGNLVFTLYLHALTSYLQPYASKEPKQSASYGSIHQSILKGVRQIRVYAVLLVQIVISHVVCICLTGIHGRRSAYRSCRGTAAVLTSLGKPQRRKRCRSKCFRPLSFTFVTSTLSVSF
jgi:hypothetical protein